MEGFNWHFLPPELLETLCKHISAPELGRLLLTGNNMLRSKLNASIRSVRVEYGPGTRPTWPTIIFSSLLRLEHVDLDTLPDMMDYKIVVYDANFAQLPRCLKTIKIGPFSVNSKRFPQSLYPGRSRGKRVTNILIMNIATEFPQLEHFAMLHHSITGETSPKKFACATLPLVTLELAQLKSTAIPSLPATLTALKLNEFLASSSKKIDFPANLRILQIRLPVSSKAMVCVLSNLPNNLLELEMILPSVEIADLQNLPRSLKSLSLSTRPKTDLIVSPDCDFALIFPS